MKACAGLVLLVGTLAHAQPGRVDASTRPGCAWASVPTNNTKPAHAFMNNTPISSLDWAFRDP